MILTVVGLGAFVTALDQTVVVTALPSLMLDLKISLTQLDRASWIITAYLLGYTAAMPVIGRLADVYGYTRVYQVSLVVFVIGTSLVAVSQSLEWMVAARVIQAVGGGATVPIGLAIAGSALPRKQWGLALGIVAGAAEAGSMLGPAYGGAIIELANWRWIFWLNVPQSAVLFLALFWLPNQPNRQNRIDYLGSALLVAADSDITEFDDIRDKRIAATKGTDPYFFLLRALQANGLSASDVRIVHLQHPEGRTALEQGRVDVWAGLDPHMAASEAAGVRFLYRNPDFGLAAFLNTSEQFLAEEPEAVEIVLAAYERARQWILDNPQQTAELIARETSLPVDVIKLQLGRYDFSRPLPGTAHLDAIRPVIPLLQGENILRRNADADAALNSLLATDIAQHVIEDASQ